MAFIKKTWVNNETYIMAEDLNRIEDAIGTMETEFGNQITALSNGTPTVVTLAEEMTDQTKIYLYRGSEAGYTPGCWYYWNGSAWTNGGTYGQGSVDSVLDSSSVNPVQNQAIANEISGVYDSIGTNTTKIENILQALGAKFDGARVEDGYLYLTINGEDATPPLGPFGGGGSGGGGSGNNAVITVTNTSGWLSKTISDTEECNISFTWSSEEDGLTTGAGTVTLKVNGTTKIQRSIDQGNVTIEVSRYLGNGTNTVRVTVADVYGNQKTISFSVSVVAFNLSSTFDDTLAYDSNVVFSYVPTGAPTKRMQFILDGTVIGSTDVTTSGRTLNYTIPVQSHGAHSFEVYFTADVNGALVESNHLYYEIIFIESGNNTPVISSSLKTRTVNQYYTVTIPYTVYTPNSMTSEVTIYEDGVQKAYLDNANRTKQSYSFRAYSSGTVTVTIESGVTTKEFVFTVIPSEVDVEAETNGLDLFLSPIGRSNSEATPGTWTYNGYTSTFTDFDWASNGWLTDDDGHSVLRVSNNARVNIGYQIFGQDFRTFGKTIEIDFATRDVADQDAVIISCLDGTRGIRFTPTHCSLASELTSIEGVYKDEEHTRISFVVEKRADNRLIFIYINGVMSSIVQYSDNDNFQQTTPVGITLGSNYATLDIYAIRVYNNNLSREQILNNWIADTPDGYTLLQRYEHNDIYDPTGKIVLEKIPNDLPYMVISSSALPQYKGNKITVYGYYVDPLSPIKSFTFTNASMDVQGTSSQAYPRKNYKIKFKNFDNTEVTGANEPPSVYQLRDNSVPTATFTFKADFASSEGANNVELARLYNDICPAKTPPQKAQENMSEDDALTLGRVRQGIDGIPIVMFWNNTDTGTTTFLGKYNFNNDKGTNEVFGLNAGDESWEILRNDSPRVNWKSADYSTTDWQEDFESRYPEDYFNISKVSSMASWLVTTDQDAATDEALAETYVSTMPDEIDPETGTILSYKSFDTDSAEYRVAKFHDEIGNYWDVDDLIFYYLFTEIFLMVDSRGKNMFPTLYEPNNQEDTPVWQLLPYDFDTANGIDNNGKLTFGWSLEDTDHSPYDVNTNVYNTQNSVLWINTRDAFKKEITNMYQNLRASSLSYQVVEQRFEEHQEKWPEAIFNEDAYFKYVQPLINDNQDYLEMALGSKASQRQWWLSNRFRYMDSKYATGDATSKSIYFKTYGVGDVTLTPYADVYLRAKFGSTTVGPIRAYKDIPVTLENPLISANDIEVWFYSADYLKDVTDISPLKIGTNDFSQATRVQTLKIGDEDSEYSNGNLTSLNLGNNRLLKTLDVSNCPNLANEVDVSACHNLEVAKFGGTAVPSVKLPNGGVLQTLILPDTVTNLTLRNQPYLTTLTLASYSQITSLWLENVGSVVDFKTALVSIASTARVRLIDIDWTVSDAVDVSDIVDVLANMSGIDANNNNVENPQLSGTITSSSGDIWEDDIDTFAEKYPTVRLVYNTAIPYRQHWSTTKHHKYYETWYLERSFVSIQSYIQNNTYLYEFHYKATSGSITSWPSAYWSGTPNIKILSIYSNGGTIAMGNNYWASPLGKLEHLQLGGIGCYFNGQNYYAQSGSVGYSNANIVTIDVYYRRSAFTDITKFRTKDIVTCYDYQTGEYLATRTGGAYTYWGIVNRLTNVTTNNDTDRVTASSSYTATLTADSGKTITSVIVLQGDATDITADVYDSSTHTITISSVTNFITITAVAE